ncbi:MAG: hypothetical protein JWL85_896 [Candidatus Saccharibacteria bacterium]|nr:hypothetical protein [Candidatus Saccharibacteria bacterium]
MSEKDNSRATSFSAEKLLMTKPLLELYGAITKEKQVIYAYTDRYQSDAFRAAGFHVVPPQPGVNADGLLHAMVYADGTQTFVMSIDMEVATRHEADTPDREAARPLVYMFHYDGANTLTEIGSDNTWSQFHGDKARPENFFATVNELLGTFTGRDFLIEGPNLN